MVLHPFYDVTSGHVRLKFAIVEPIEYTWSNVYVCLFCYNPLAFYLSN